MKASSEFGENEYIKFKLQLVNATNEQLIGEYNVITFNQANIISNFSETFSVNTNGIGNKNVILKIITEENINGAYDIANINADDRILPKKNVKEITYSNKEIIAEYALEQNFPNPFNPVTTINYQLPQTGFVMLKIYDILGKEVATLVNEQKNQGRYSVNFNASRLASGVYIYQLRVNDYVSLKEAAFAEVMFRQDKHYFHKYFIFNNWRDIIRQFNFYNRNSIKLIILFPIIIVPDKSSQQFFR